MERPTLQQLTYLVAVDEHRHFGKAADACFVSQPALSSQIRELERRLGVTLFERGNRKVLPTSVGATVIERARECCATWTSWWARRASIRPSCADRWPWG